MSQLSIGSTRLALGAIDVPAVVGRNTPRLVFADPLIKRNFVLRVTSARCSSRFGGRHEQHRTAG